jgi:hypothetical protein
VHAFNRQWQFHDVKLSSYVDAAFHAVAIDERRRPFVPTLWEQQAHSKDQIMEQVWFTGVHSNVGGGYQDAGLSDLTFLWMKGKAEAFGLAFDETLLPDTLAPKPNPLGELRDSRLGLYKLIPPVWRRMGEGAMTNQRVYFSAVERMERDPGYRPDNLVKFLQRHGAVVPREQS